MEVWWIRRRYEIKKGTVLNENENNYLVENRGKFAVMKKNCFLSEDKAIETINNNISEDIIRITNIVSNLNDGYEKTRLINKIENLNTLKK